MDQELTSERRQTAAQSPDVDDRRVPEDRGLIASDLRAWIGCIEKARR